MSRKSDRTNNEVPSKDGYRVSPFVAPVASAQPERASAPNPLINAAEPDSLDPFQPENLRIDLDLLNEGGTKKLLTTVPVRKPNKQDFIRVHPDPKYRETLALIELQDDRETYIVHPSYARELEPTLYSINTLFLSINRQKTVFLWPVKMPAPDGREMAWHTSARDAAERAMKDWLRLAVNRNLGAYEIFLAECQQPAPEWPALSFAEILRIAFKDRIIRDPDHPVMQRLRGVT